MDMEWAVEVTRGLERILDMARKTTREVVELRQVLREAGIEIRHLSGNVLWRRAGCGRGVWHELKPRRE